MNSLKARVQMILDEGIIGRNRRHEPWASKDMDAAYADVVQLITDAAGAKGYAITRNASGGDHWHSEPSVVGKFLGTADPAYKTSVGQIELTFSKGDSVVDACLDVSTANNGGNSWKHTVLGKVVAFGGSWATHEYNQNGNVQTFIRCSVEEYFSTYIERIKEKLLKIAAAI